MFSMRKAFVVTSALVGGALAISGITSQDAAAKEHRSHTQATQTALGAQLYSGVFSPEDSGPNKPFVDGVRQQVKAGHRHQADFNTNGVTFKRDYNTGYLVVQRPQQTGPQIAHDPNGPFVSG
jgi:hypothetical protein